MKRAGRKIADKKEINALPDQLTDYETVYTEYRCQGTRERIMVGHSPRPSKRPGRINQHLTCQHHHHIFRVRWCLFVSFNIVVIIGEQSGFGRDKDSRVIDMIKPRSIETTYRRVQKERVHSLR